MEQKLPERLTDGSVNSVRELIRMVEELVADGGLRPGDRLPPVRELATLVGMSPSSVAAAWRSLNEKGLLRGMGRSGTFVVKQTRPSNNIRWRPHFNPGVEAIELSTGFPDRNLLPKIQPRHFNGIDDLSAYSYLDNPVLDNLEKALRGIFEPEFDGFSLTITDGTLDAIDRLLSITITRGDLVAVEDPGFPAIFDLVEANQGRILAVETDEHGMTVSSLISALTMGAKVIISQPRAQNPTGASRNDQRMRDIVEAISKYAPQVTVIEDDHSALISGRELNSLAHLLPRQTAYVASFSKSHGPDLRLAAIFGPAELIDELQERRRLGPAWSSRALQRLLANLLLDDEAVAQVEDAKHAYQIRRRSIESLLQISGLTENQRGDGLNIWVPVVNERSAILSLATNGVIVAPGSDFKLTESIQDHIRMTLCISEEMLETIAPLLVSATSYATANWRM